MVVVGGSVAGVRLARALRECGHTGSIRILEAGSDLPHDKPPLSKAPLGAEHVVPLLDPGAAAELRIDVDLDARVVGVDPETKQVTVESGELVDYDVLVIATGVRPRTMPWDGPRIHTLRTAEDSRSFRAQLDRASRLLVVGAGLIGAEVAAMARAAGVATTMVDPAEVPLARVVGAELGRRLSELQVANGVDLRLGTSVIELTSGPETVEAVLSDGTTLDVDLVLVGIGAEVDAAWLTDSGLPVDDGLVCDRFGRVVGTSQIFAIGDVARWNPESGRGSRAEHWTNAVDQAVCVANNIVRPGEPSAVTNGSYVWSDQYDWKVQVFGRADVSRTPALIETADPFRLAGLWWDDDGELVGGVTINWPRASVTLRRAIAARVPGKVAFEDVAALGRPA